jgi:hypothetical protein
MDFSYVSKEMNNSDWFLFRTRNMPLKGPIAFVARTLASFLRYILRHQTRLNNKISVPTPQETHYISATETNRFNVTIKELAEFSDV